MNQHNKTHELEDLFSNIFRRHEKIDRKDKLNFVHFTDQRLIYFLLSKA